MAENGVHENVSENKQKIVDLTTLNQYLSEWDNLNNASYLSDIPDICKEYSCMLGIDEAGRGPVLGPMVYGIAFCPVNKTDLLEKLQCDDSKALTEEKRDDIFSNICKETNYIGWAVEVISPNVICNSMFRRSKHSLNEVSMDAAIKLIRTVADAGVDITHIFVDTVGPPEKYQAYLSGLFPKYKITVAKKADSTYPIVSAASICAKVVRDHALRTWNFVEGLDLTHRDFGSGYPNDPVTKKFLSNVWDPVFGFPQLVRFSWSTAGAILDEHAYHVDWEDVEDNKPAVRSKSIKSFFSSTKQKSTKEKHKFFKERKLEKCTEL